MKIHDQLTGLISEAKKTNTHLDILTDLLIELLQKLEAKQGGATSYSAIEKEAEFIIGIYPTTKLNPLRYSGYIKNRSKEASKITGTVKESLPELTCLLATFQQLDISAHKNSNKVLIKIWNEKTFEILVTGLGWSSSLSDHNIELYNRVYAHIKEYNCTVVLVEPTDPEYEYWKIG